MVSKNPGTTVSAGQGALMISAADNVSALAQRVLPTGTTAVECRLTTDGDQGQTWGTGMALAWPGGQQLRINVRIPDAPSWHTSFSREYRSLSCREDPAR